MTEISASDYLEARRREQDNFIELSFDTICAYGPNAAMMHYAATPESDAELKPEGFLLVDSGGHYFEGTTDITRTMALGPITDEMRLHFTTVCRSNMNLANAKFLYGLHRTESRYFIPQGRSGRWALITSAVPDTVWATF